MVKLKSKQPSKNELPPIRLKTLQTHDYEEQFESILKESSLINEFSSALRHFSAMSDFTEAAKALVTQESEKRFVMLPKLRKQIDLFQNQSQTSVIKSSAALEKNFNDYHEQQKKYRTELVNLFVQHFSEYLKKNNPLSIGLLDDYQTLISLQLAELGIEGNAQNQWDACIQLIEKHVPLTINFKNALDTLKKAYSIDPEISQFIFIAYEEAFLSLKKKI